MPSPIASFPLLDRAPSPQGDALNSANERLIAMIRDRHPALGTVLDLLDCGPFSRLSLGVVEEGLPALLRGHPAGFVDGSSSTVPDEPVRPTPPRDWTSPWNEPLPIVSQAHQNVWGWAATADQARQAMDHLRLWVQQRLTRLGEAARTEAVHALLDDRWGFSVVLRKEDPDALRALWGHAIDLLAELPGSWPDGPLGLVEPPVDALDDHRRARAWVERAVLHQVMQHGDHASWAVPLLTELAGGPAVWTTARLPLPEWTPWNSGPKDVPVLPPVALAFASFSFALADAMVRAGARIEGPLPDVTIDDAPHRSPHARSTGTAPDVTLLGIAWGAWSSQLPNTLTQFPWDWEHPLVGTDAMVALLSGTAGTSSPCFTVAQGAWRHANLTLVPDASGRLNLTDDTLPATPIQPPRLLVQTVDEGIGQWLDSLPPAMWASPRGRALVPLRQALEAVQLHRTVQGTPDARSAPKTRL